MRYAVFTSFFIEAESNEEAIAKARHLAARQDTKNDDMCTVEKVLGQGPSLISERPVIYTKEKATTGIVA